MGAESHSIGQWGESVAAEYLENFGYRILARNYHTAKGEIDLVAINLNTRLPCLIFVEVKTRTSKKHGYPEEAVTRKKWDHLQAAIQCYLSDHPESDIDWCVDVIAIIGHPNQKHPQIQHYKSVVMVDDNN